MQSEDFPRATSISLEPMNSEDFLPPTHKAFKIDGNRGEGAADRGRTVHAVALHMHYELLVQSDDSELGGEPRMQPFNPAVHGPACPPQITGKNANESELDKLSDDPIAQGRLIEKETPYDQFLYSRRDPRLISKTVVVRDYSCKIPIDLTDTEKIARACLNHYPDQYVAFLGEFVSNLFGSSMQHFLQAQQDGLQKILDNPEDLNRVSWSAYMNVQGGKECEKDHLSEVDRTLPYSKELGTALASLTKNGRHMTGQYSAEDYFDLRPCLRQHIATLKKMRTELCRGFASKEEDALAMIWYANEQGRKLCDNLQLLAKEDEFGGVSEPDFSRMNLHVPLNLFYDPQESRETPAIENPQKDASVRKTLEDFKRKVYRVPTVLYPWGAWSGANQGGFFSATPRSPYHWGWGHAATAWVENNQAPYHSYAQRNDAAVDTRFKKGFAFVNDKYGSFDTSFRERNKVSAADQQLPKSVRASIGRRPEDDVWRGTNSYRQAEPVGGLTRSTNNGMSAQTRRHPAVSDEEELCADFNQYSLQDSKYSAGGGKFDMLSVACRDVASRAEYPVAWVKPFTNDTVLAASVRLPVVWNQTLLDFEKFVDDADATKLDPEQKKQLLQNLICPHSAQEVNDDRALETAIVVPNHCKTNYDVFSRVAVKGLRTGPAPRLPNGTWEYRKILSQTYMGDPNINGYENTTPVVAGLFTRRGAVPMDPLNVNVAQFATNVSLKDLHPVLKVLFLRQFLQNTHGMFVAGLIFHNIFGAPVNVIPGDADENDPDHSSNKIVDFPSVGTVFEPAKATQWNAVMTKAGSDYKFVSKDTRVTPAAPDSSPTGLPFAVGGNVFQLQHSTSLVEIKTENDQLKAIYEVAMDIIVDRMVLMLQADKCRESGQKQKQKELLRRYVNSLETETEKVPRHLQKMFFTGFNDATNVYGLNFRSGLDNLPTELFLQTPDVPYFSLFLYSNCPAQCKAQYEDALHHVPQLGSSRPAGQYFNIVGAGAEKVQDYIMKLCKTGSERFAGPIAVYVTELGKECRDAFRGHRSPPNGLEEEMYRANSKTCNNNPLYGKRLPFIIHTHGENPDDLIQGHFNKLLYNKGSWSRPQGFAQLDAAALLWNSRSFFNPADCNRPPIDGEDNYYDQPDNMHYWCRTLVESFAVARQRFLRDYPGELYEKVIKVNPQKALPAKLIGSMTDDTFKHLFPLIPTNHRIRDVMRDMRAMDVLWGTLPLYRASSTTGGVSEGAWMPLSMAHHVKLLQTVGLFDADYQVISNPWLVHNNRGISRVYNQSYHSCYHNASYRAPHFQDWLTTACRYQPPRFIGTRPYYPFSQYGGTPVEGDFLPHRVEKPHGDKSDKFVQRSKELVYNRFGMTGPLRVGNQFHDTGLLQDLYSFEYRQYAKLSRAQRSMPAATAVYPSNFMAYARTHAILALASCNLGTEQASVPQIVRNLYRVYVDSYEVMGIDPKDEGVPVIMGFLPSPVDDAKEDRPITLYAGTLACLNAKISAFCSSHSNRGERVCQIYKQVYLNDAAVLFTRLMRRGRRAKTRKLNYKKAIVRRSRLTPEDFNEEFIDLQDYYIEFLQTTLMGLLIESGADLSKIPVHLLEPRELQVSLYAENPDVMASDFVTPRTREIVNDIDFSGKDNLTRSQLAILSLIPPNHRILGAFRVENPTQTVEDLKHVKDQIMKETIKSNQKVTDRYINAFVAANVAKSLLEVDGPVDYSFDISSIQDPLKESEAVARRMSTTQLMPSSSTSLHARRDRLLQDTSASSVIGMGKQDMGKALQDVRDLVEKEYNRHGGKVLKIRCLATLPYVPVHMKRMLKPEYEI